MIDKAVSNLLRAKSGLTSVAPTTSVKRITEVPSLMYAALNGTRNYTDDGPVGVIPALYQVDAYAATPTDARTLLEKLTRSAYAAEDPGLDGYAGTVEGTKIVRIHFPSEPRFGPVALASEGANTTTARLILDMTISYRPS